MGRYILRRCLWMPLVLLILVTVSFFMIRFAPGGPFSRERQVPKEIQANIEARYRLDKPIWQQYLFYLSDLIRFDLGPSYKYRDRTVNEIIAHHLPKSVVLGSVAMLLALAIGLTAGTIAAVRQNSIFDYASMSVAMVGLATPTFVTGTLLVFFFSMKLDWFRVAGWDEFPRDLVLPAVTLSLPFAARIARLTRAGMLEVIGQDYVRTAYAKGLGERVVILRHVMKGALLPVVSYLGPAMADVLVGSLVVEKIFGVPGIGRALVDAAVNRDYTLVMGLVLLDGVLLLVLNLVVDVVYGFLDPRIRYD